MIKQICIGKQVCKEKKYATGNQLISNNNKLKANYNTESICVSVGGERYREREREKMKERETKKERERMSASVERCMPMCAGVCCVYG